MTAATEGDIGPTYLRRGLKSAAGKGFVLTEDFVLKKDNVHAGPIKQLSWILSLRTAKAQGKNA